MAIRHYGWPGHIVLTMKIIPNISGLTGIVVAACIGTAVAESRIDTDFNDGTSQSWSLVTTAGATAPMMAVIPGGPEGSLIGRSVLQLDDSVSSGTATYATLGRNFISQTAGFIDVALKVRFLSSGSTPDKGDWRIALTGSTGTIYIRMKTSGANSGFTYYNGSSFVASAISQITIGDWYEVRISADLTKKTYDWTVRNLTDTSVSQRARMEDVPFYLTGDNASKLAITTVARGGKLQIDDARLDVHRNNLAEGKSYAFSASPSYTYCTEVGDATQATDGLKKGPGFISPSLWTLPECIGWQGPTVPLTATVDLGAIRPISGFGVNMAAGTSAGVAWPSGILCFVSDDGTNWYYLSDLVEAGDLANDVISDGGWTENGGRVHKFSSDAQTHGRYVCFAVLPGSSFVFFDELEIYEGSSSNLALALPDPAVAGVTGIGSFAREYRTKGGLLKRITLDQATLTDRIETANITPMQKASLLADLENAANSARTATIPVPSAFSSVMPMNAGHAAIFAVQGGLWRALGNTQPVIWREHRYKWHTPFHNIPASSDTSTLNTRMLRNEIRAEAIYISNPTSDPIYAEISTEYFPGLSGWVRVFSADWTDTFQHTAVCSVLTEVNAVTSIYTVNIPAGMTRKVWLQVDTNHLSDGSFSGDLRVKISGNSTVIPWNIRVSLMALNPPRLDVMMWDYLNGNAGYGLTPSNRAAALSLMRTHSIRTAWGTAAILPLCGATHFNAGDQLIVPLDFTKLDNWLLTEVPGADRYFIFMNISGSASGSSFAGAAMGTASFDARVGAWIAAIASHVFSEGVDPAKLTFLVWDEPKEVWQYELSAAWMEAIKAGDSRVKCFIDPSIKRVTPVTDYETAIAAADIVCASTFSYNIEGGTVRSYYQQQKTLGKNLYFYVPNGPVKMADPTGFYRLHSWMVFKEGGSGLGFWSLGDTAGAVSSWNEYTATRDSYTPLFLSDTVASTSIHFEALREGIEDNELFQQLDAAVALSADPAIQTRWNSLKTDLEHYTGAIMTVGRWPAQNPPETADEIRRNAIELLENANGLYVP